MSRDGSRHPVGDAWGKRIPRRDLKRALKPYGRGGGEKDGGNGGCWPFLLGVYGLLCAAMTGILVGSWPW